MINYCLITRPGFCFCLHDIRYADMLPVSERHMDSLSEALFLPRFCGDRLLLTLDCLEECWSSDGVIIMKRNGKGTFWPSVKCILCGICNYSITSQDLKNERL